MIGIVALRALLRVIFVWAVTAAGILVCARLVPGVHVGSLAAAFGGAAVIGLLHAVVWPLLIRLTLRITVLTIGLGALALNGLTILAAAAIVPRFEVKSIWSGIALAIIIALLNTIATTALLVDNDDFYYRSVVRRLIPRVPGAQSSVPGVVFIQIDGLAHEVLVHAMRNGEAATMARWVRTGSHRLLSWETDWSSQTGASQAGLLHGSNRDMPAFRWWEKERGVAMVTNHPRDAMEIERRQSNGNGLLAHDGASRSNVVSGDAGQSSLTMSTVLRPERPGSLAESYFAYFANPYNVIRTLLLSIAEVITELWNAADERRRDIVPRVNRGFSYALIRAWTCVVSRDLQVEAVIGDMLAGRSVVYTDFLGYDEVAHHSGTERHDSLRVLRRIDRQLARLEVAARDAPRPYQFAVLSDHGQTQGQTFRQRWGTTLDALVEEASTDASVEAHGQGDESWGYLSGSLTEASVGSSVGSQVIRTVTRKRTSNGVVLLGPDARALARSREGEPPEIVVLASGCMGLIYFAGMTGRVTLEQIEARHPGLIARLRNHPGIGFLLVRSERDGSVVLGRSGTRYLATGRVEGDDPLAAFGPNAIRHVTRTDGFANVADITVNSAYNPQSGEVFAFEELIGSHGGLGGPQSYPFLMVPSEWAVPQEPMVGAETVHRQLRHWLADLGHQQYR